MLNVRVRCNTQQLGETANTVSRVQEDNSPASMCPEASHYPAVVPPHYRGYHGLQGRAL